MRATGILRLGTGTQYKTGRSPEKGDYPSPASDIFPLLYVTTHVALWCMPHQNLSILNKMMFLEMMICVYGKMSCAQPLCCSKIFVTCTSTSPVTVHAECTALVRTVRNIQLSINGEYCNYSAPTDNWAFNVKLDGTDQHSKYATPGTPSDWNWVDNN